jgi:hypothetical protein
LQRRARFMAESASEIAGSLVPVAKQQAMILLEAGYIWLDMGKFDKAKDVFGSAVRPAARACWRSATVHGQGP